MTDSMNTIAPARIRSYAEMDEILEDNLGRTLERGPAAKRVFDIARAKYGTTAEQHAAIITAAQREFAERREFTATERDINRFADEPKPSLTVGAGAPMWPLEGKRRPHWAKRADDEPIREGRKVTSLRSMSWGSAYVSVPAAHYSARVNYDGGLTGADLRVFLRQGVLEVEPMVCISRMGYSPDGKWLPDNMRHEMTTAEAVLLARALLLYVDLATGVPEQLAADTEGGE